MDKKLEDNNVESRRSFLKKAAYAAPTIVALGSISKPVSAMASNTSYDNSNSGSSDTPSSDPTNNDEGGFQSPF